MLLDSFEFWVQKKCLGKTFLKVWSQICGQIAMLIHKFTLKKSAIKKKKIQLKYLKVHFLQSYFSDTLSYFSTNIFITVFPKLFFLFLCKAQHCLETCVNCVWNCVTPLFTLRGPVSKKYFFQKWTPPSSEMLDLLQRLHLKGIGEKNRGYF